MTFELWNPTTYDALRRQLIPSFDLLYGSASSAVQMSVPGHARILDLGAGTGLLSAALIARIPEATITLVDHSERMLAQAKQRFDSVHRVSFAVQGLMDPLPAGPYDAVVSGLAIHHLEHHEKQTLFGRLPDILRPGGIFVNVEQVLAPTPRLEEMYDRQHEGHVHAAGTPADEWAAGRERMKHDICIDVETQLGWLRAAGFDTVDCLAKDWRFATYAGWLAS